MSAGRLRIMGAAIAVAALVGCGGTAKATASHFVELDPKGELIRAE